MRAEYDALPSTQEACGKLIETVIAERRETVKVRLSALQMGGDGRISRGEAGIGMSEHGFAQFMGRVSAALTEEGQEGLGGAGSFLRRCPTELRARNVNHFLNEVKAINPSAEVALRYRWGASGREVFAAVSPTYTPFDVNRIAAGVAMAAPQSARSEIAYDGIKARIQVLFHTTTSPEHIVAGEIFRAGVIVSTDDTGGGAIRCTAVVWQNLCRNLIVIDRSEQETCRLRHVGSEARLAAEFRAGFTKALGKVDRFVDAWDQACEIELKPEVAPRVQAMSGQQLREALIKASIEDAIKRELVPVAGRKANAVHEVFSAWKQDTSGAAQAHGGLNVAALANAFTRYAHETAAQRDPWISDEIQQAAGQLVWKPEMLRR